MQTFLEYAKCQDEINSIFEQIINEAEKNEVLKKLLDESFLGEGAWSNLGRAALDAFAGREGAYTTSPISYFRNALASLKKAQQIVINSPPQIGNSLIGNTTLKKWLNVVVGNLEKNLGQRPTNPVAPVATQRGAQRGNNFSTSYDTSTVSVPPGPTGPPANPLDTVSYTT